MSRAYRIMVKGSIERVVHVEDGVCSALELLPILPKERMREILASELTQRGFTRDGSKVRRTEKDGTTTEVDLEHDTVSVRVASEVALKLERQRTDNVYEERMEGARERMQEALDADLERLAKVSQERARQEATALLERKLKDLRLEVDRVTNRVTAEALKEKAAQMGEIEEIHEDSETGTLTIKVKV